VYKNLQKALIEAYFPEEVKQYMKSCVDDPKKSAEVAERLYKLFGLNMRIVLDMFGNDPKQAKISELINFLYNNLERYHQEIVSLEIYNKLNNPQKRPNFIKKIVEYFNNNIWRKNPQDPDAYLNESNEYLSEMFSTGLYSIVNNIIKMEKYQKKK
jgi:hypothetical protein